MAGYYRVAETPVDAPGLAEKGHRITLHLEGWTFCPLQLKIYWLYVYDISFSVQSPAYKSFVVSHVGRGRDG